MPASFKHLSISKQVCEGSVLAKWPSDGRFYKVDIVAIDQKDQKVRVKYEDDYECWCKPNELHIQLAFDSLQDESIVCCVCDDGFSKAPNEIIMCDSCQQGYHISCHKPVIDREASKLDDENVEWICATCDELVMQAHQLNKIKPIKQANTPSSSQKKTQSPRSTIKKTVKKTPRSTKKSSSNESSPKTRITSTDNNSKGSPKKRTTRLEVVPMEDNQEGDLDKTQEVTSTGEDTIDNDDGETKSTQTEHEKTQSTQTDTNKKTEESPKQIEFPIKGCKNENQIDDNSSKTKPTERSQTRRAAASKEAAKIQEAPDEIIDLAKALAQKESNLTTDTFVNLISDHSDEKTNVKIKMPRKTNKTARKLVKTADAY